MTAKTSDNSGDNTGALAGYRILDLTHVLAGPFATYQLAVLGAEVIKIEPPDLPDMMRHEGPDWTMANAGLGIHYQSQSANKKSITLNLGQPQGKEIFERLVATADVVVSNYRLSSQNKLGLDKETLRQFNKNIIVCSITGFGQTGPKADHAAYDNVIQAFSGLMEATGFPDGDGCKVGPPVLDYGTGAQAALAITAALLQRETQGIVADLDIAMLDAALMLMTSSVTETAFNDKSPSLHGNSSQSKPGYACFDTANGKLMVGAFTAAQHAALWMVLGREDLSEAVSALSAQEIDQRFTADRSELSKCFAQRDADHWESLLNTAGIPAARVRSLAETLEHPQVKSRSVLQSMHSDTANLHPTTYAVNAWNSETVNGRINRAPPVSGQDNADVFQSLGLSSDELEQLQKDCVI